MSLSRQNTQNFSRLTICIMVLVLQAPKWISTCKVSSSDPRNLCWNSFKKSLEPWTKCVANILINILLPSCFSSLLPGYSREFKIICEKYNFDFQKKTLMQETGTRKNRVGNTPLYSSLFVNSSKILESRAGVIIWFSTARFPECTLISAMNTQYSDS